MTEPATRRRLALAGLLAALLLGAGAWMFLRRGQAPPPVPPPPATAPPAAAPAAAAGPAEPLPPPELRVEAVTGAVDLASHGAGWRPLQAGTLLRPDEQLRTGPGARAELAAGEASRLVVTERTQLEVRELTAAVHRFRLARGIVKVDYRPDGDRVVRVEEASGAAIAEARGARFHVAANGLAFAVATETGGVTLSAAGAAVTVGAGEQALASAGGPPSAPRPIPTSVLLKVAAASRVGASSRCLDTEGRSEPGALATVNGQPVPVAADGTFPVRVPRDGRGEAVVRVVLPDGRESVRRLPCGTLSPATIEDLEVRWRHAD